MRIECYNIGKVESAKIDISKITLIAGLNSTGKSTIGKTLYSVFNSLYNYEENIFHQKKDFLSYHLSKRKWGGDDRYLMNKFSSRCVEMLSNEVKPISSEKVIEIINSNFETEKIAQLDPSLIKNITDFFNTEDEEFVDWFLQRRFKMEFADQVQNLMDPDCQSSIKLVIQGETTEIVISNNEIASFSGKKSLRTRAIYFDDPFVLDNMGSLFVENGHQNELINRFGMKIPDDLSGSANEFLTEKKLNRIFEKLSLVWNGEVSKKERGISFFERNIGKNLDVKNISTGLKTFIIIKILLLNGSLEENGTLILDEPEVHLHPAWQKILAEIIVLIQIEFGMHILINSHSSFFIEAIETYEKNYGIRNKCNFYLAEENAHNKSSTFKDVSDDLQPIYRLLYDPLEWLMAEQQKVLNECKV